MISLVLVRFGGMSPVTGMLGWSATGCTAVIDRTRKSCTICKRFDFTVLTVSDDVVKRLCVRIMEMENKGNIVVDVCY